MMPTLSCGKAGLGIALAALIVAMPLSAASATETETAAMPPIAIESINTTACTTFIDAGGETAVNCDDIANAIAEAMDAECQEYGGRLGDFDMVTCFHLGGGYYLVRAEGSCVY